MKERPPSKPPAIPPPRESEQEIPAFTKPADAKEIDTTWTPRAIQDCQALIIELGWPKPSEDQTLRPELERAFMEAVREEVLEMAARTGYTEEDYRVPGIAYGYKLAIRYILDEKWNPKGDNFMKTPQDVMNILERTLQMLKEAK